MPFRRPGHLTLLRDHRYAGPNDGLTVFGGREYVVPLVGPGNVWREFDRGDFARVFLKRQQLPELARPRLRIRQTAGVPELDGEVPAGG